MSDIFFPKFPICSNVFGHLGCNVRPDIELEDDGNNEINKYVSWNQLYFLNSTSYTGDSHYY